MPDREPLQAATSARHFTFSPCSISTTSLVLSSYARRTSRQNRATLDGIPLPPFSLAFLPLYVRFAYLVKVLFAVNNDIRLTLDHIVCGIHFSHLILDTVPLKIPQNMSVFLFSAVADYHSAPLFKAAVSSAAPPPCTSCTSSTVCAPIKASGQCTLAKNAAALYASICSGIFRHFELEVQPSALAIFSGKMIRTVVQKRLRAFLNHFFTIGAWRKTVFTGTGRGIPPRSGSFP